MVPYVRRTIPEPGDPDREEPVNEAFHEQTYEKLTEKELKHVEADDQAIQTILLGLPEDSCCDPDREEPVNEAFHEQTYEKLTEKELKHVEADDQAIQTILLGLPEDSSRSEGNGNRKKRNQIQCYNYRGMGHLARNCTQASTSSTHTDNAPVYDSDGSAEVHHYDNCYNNDIFNMFTQVEQFTELLEPIPEPHQVQQNDNDVVFAVSCVEQDGRIVEQHPATVEETRAYFESLYNNLAIEVEKVNSVNRKMKETNVDLTTELARYKNQEKRFEINQEKYDKLERCYQKSVYQEQCLTKKINALHLSSAKMITTLNEQIANLYN
nr:hypothetical protein [Tanacetum cinerariifolium]